MPARDSPVTDRFEDGFPTALFGSGWAPGTERAPLGPVIWTRWHPGDTSKPILARHIDTWCRGQESLGVVVLWSIEDLVAAPRLDDGPRVHHQDPVADFGNHAQ